MPTTKQTTGIALADLQLTLEGQKEQKFKGD